MFGCDCFWWSNFSEFQEPQPFSLPSPLPHWPQGQGFATGKICLGAIEVLKITEFEPIWNCNHLRGNSKGVTFYRPLGVPKGYFSLGHYCQPNDQPLRGYLLVARDVPKTTKPEHSPPLKKPLGYTSIWSTDTRHTGCGYIWLPKAPEGYNPMGFVVTNGPEEPQVEEVMCVRSDLTEDCEAYDTILESEPLFSETVFKVWKMRPIERGMSAKGVSVGTFFCTSTRSSGEEFKISCLKNADMSLYAMPNLDQIDALIKHYGPTVYFHPDELYLPSSVPWFFDNGARIYGDGMVNGERIDSKGLNLPGGGLNDGEYWIDLPSNDEKRKFLKYGNIDSAELYVHVKPALGGTFTDIAMWVFCPFNGPATIKASVMSVELNKIGEHVGDWEHFTLRISNFDGQLWSVYFSQHSGGEWVDSCNLEFIEGRNKPVVYSSKSGHASYPRPGCYIEGSSILGIGVRNDAAKSKYFVDSSTRYRIVSAEYLGDDVVNEPHWLQYMREWGPKIVYDATNELDKILSYFPTLLRFSAETLFELFPTEIYGEEGPTGPKEKDNWFGDERS